MNKQIEQIAERLRGLRDVLDLSSEDVASKIAVTVADVDKYESGQSDIPMSYLCSVAQAYDIEISALLSGDEPRVNSFYVTRKGTGAGVERNKAYKYMSLASGFRNTTIKPFEVSIEPNDAVVPPNSHAGQEFDFVLEGVLQIEIAGNTIVLNEGDSIYYDSLKPHRMKALGDKKVRFLAVVTQ